MPPIAAQAFLLYSGEETRMANDTPEPQGDMENLVKLSFFIDIGKAIASAHSIRQVLERVMRQVGAIFAPRNWSLMLIDPLRRELVFKIVVGESADKLIGARVPCDQGIGGWIYRNGQPAIVEDVRKDARFNSKVDEISGFTTSSVIGVPLKTEREVLGVIELINKLDGSDFTAFDLKILSTIADFAAIAIEKSFYIQALRYQSRYDHLTGVLNRRSLDRILAREITRAKRYKEPLAVLLVDIDDFKTVNDTHGHQAGDEVLKACADACAKWCASLIRSPATAATNSP
jgi:two-component system cell cycle response regulator